MMSATASIPGQMRGCGWKRLQMDCRVANTAKVPRNPRIVSEHSALRLCSGPRWRLGMLSLDTAGGESCDDPPLEDEHHDDERHGDEGSCGHDRGVGEFELAGPGEAGDGHGDGFCCDGG